jgi:MFS transporter, SP family, sugar:H+ symporter
MLRFLRDHNYQISEHVSSNLLLAMMVISCSVFTYGFETATLATVQAMERKLACPVTHLSDRVV